MFRKMAIVAGLTVASIVAFVPAVSAQSITLSICPSGGYGYNGYGYGNAYPGYAYGYSQPQNYGYYTNVRAVRLDDMKIVRMDLSRSDTGEIVGLAMCIEKEGLNYSGIFID